MRRIAPWLLLLLFAVGCGNSNSSSATCDHLGDAAAGLNSKYAACGTLGAIPFSKDDCTRGFENSGCTDADRQKFNDFANCLDGLPSCTPATQNSWLTSFSNCAILLQNLSSTCH
ncbi:MAG TPA: hypothetical protein VFN45_14985 [Myxococcaceae bacterium]|jgi:hypothetical protein|nr:hypothetical protein [Myxococcaceae bacterium]